jgi:two-component system CheB/CheR fusion protein
MVDDEDATPDASPEVDPGFPDLLEKLRERYNFDFREYKAASLMRRTRARMSQVRADTFADYSRYLDLHPGEHVDLFNTILINVTGFFRDPEAWTTLAEDVIPRIVEDAQGTRVIRIWSAGCSSGEESYSLAILLAERLGDRVAEYQIKIYSTDIDEDALAAARHALYRTEQLKDVPDRLLDRYFVRDGQLWRLRRDVRRWCIFGSHNLTQAPPLSHIDLLVCRNVLIYFGSALQERILARFHYAVRDGGYLFLGRSESLLARSRFFSPVNLKWRIFQRIAATARATSVLPEGAPAAVARTEPTPPGLRVQRALEALPSAVLVVDAADTIITWNATAEALFETPMPNAVGRKFRDIDVSYRVEGLRARMEEVKTRHASTRLDGVTFTRRSGELVHANVTVAPLFDSGRFIGVLVSVEDATEYARLKEQMTRIAEQHATAIEELQSTNEELETTNEELQSTNEELETTNEELQSTNEELETTVEELQAANAELAALNAELEERGAELARLDGYHRGFVNTMDEGVIGLDRAGVVRTWNDAAERMWGLRSEQVTGRELFTLPLGDFVRRLRPAFETMLDTGEAQEVDGVPHAGGAPAAGHSLVRFAPVKDGAGRVVGGVATASRSPA